MATSIYISKPNQSMLDVIIQGTGSLEAAGQFCRDNDVAISDVPAEGSQYLITPAAMALGSAAVLKYLAQHGTISKGVAVALAIGTLGGPVPVVVLVAEDGATELTDESGNVLVGE